MHRFTRCVVVSAILAAAIVATATAHADSDSGPYGKVELARDTWGVPHIFAETDAGAMYGLGYATAQDRGFQMHYTLRIIQGRLAEVIGDRLTCKCVQLFSLLLDSKGEPILAKG